MPTVEFPQRKGRDLIVVKPLLNSLPFLIGQQGWPEQPIPRQLLNQLISNQHPFPPLL